MLLIGATHGNEPIGVEVAERLKGTQWERGFDFMLGNPRAYKKGERFIDVDLNRVYPGNFESSYYEERIASENLKKAKRYNWVLDLHETKYSPETFIIVPDPDILNEELIRSTGVEIVILWPSTTGRKTGPIAQCLEGAVEVEISNIKESREKVIEKATDITINLLKREKGYRLNVDKVKQKSYKVYGKLLKEECSVTELNDFTETKVNGEVFVPLFTDQYLDKGIKCYKMEILEN